ncbi:DUF418 domain-containing protein [Sphingomonas sp. S2-65]|uniref:DUF418 domain-containing protein n=1 Tax=Sphingomonas sp. S2-65 TaxID=2903960 RepID=UPI001F1B8A15|nr:DUF418 domain-containing protein [Sphingomonas sp. S2-65]UYY58316.1 DUF418 domain-containing protein [Sphingomonas sp. S2-65]
MVETLPAHGKRNERIAAVDIVRGFALMALFLVHMMESYELYWSNPQPGVADTVFLLFMGKSFSLLALCFGFSFFILMDRAAQRGEDFSLRFAWRLLILGAIGVVHGVIYRGDIIQVLAVIGMLLLAIHRVRDNRLLAAIAGFLLLAPSLWFQLIAAALGADWANQPSRSSHDPAMATYLGGTFTQTLHANLWQGQMPKWWFMFEYGRIVQILGLFVLGMLLGRVGFFERLDRFTRARRVALGCCVGLMAASHFWRGWVFNGFAGLGYGDGANRMFDAILASWFELAGTFTWGLVILELCRTPAIRLLDKLAPVGRATLTLYILQSVIFVPLFYNFGLGLWDDWSQETRLSVALGAIGLQLWGARLWFVHFHYGPIEWVWRALTYWRRDVPFRREPARAGGLCAA